MSMPSEIKSPEEFFGHKMGADRKLVRWEKIVEYFWHLDKSPCVKVTDLGKSTEGNPFLLAVISSPENIKNLKRIREMSYNIAHPQGLSNRQLDRIFKDGKTVVSMTMSIHASEVGGTQMSPELCHEVATSPEHEEIRQNTVLLVFPSFNPDGQIMVTDWYNEHLDTEYGALGLRSSTISTWATTTTGTPSTSPRWSPRWSPRSCTGSGTPRPT